MFSKTYPVFQTIKETKLKIAGRSIVQQRFIIVSKDGDINLPAGRLLLYLGEENRKHNYRTAEGQAVYSLQQLQLGSELKEVEDQEIISAMNAFRTHEDRLEERGLSFGTPAYGYPPFDIIKCPMCGHTQFVSFEHAEVFCNHCFCDFTVRETAGDPGFVIDAFPKNYNWKKSFYIIPPSNTIYFCMVFKNSLSPILGRRNAESENIELTGENDYISIRPGIDRDSIFSVYEWRMGGRVPVKRDLDNFGQHLYECQGKNWRETSTVEVLSLPDPLSIHTLENLKYMLDEQEYTKSYVELLENLISRPGSAPYIYDFHMDRLPDPRKLSDGEYYLLHHWMGYKEGFAHYAGPIWYVVKPVEINDYTTEFKVIADNFCPECMKQVSPEDMEEFDKVKNYEYPWDETDNHHASCFSIWKKIGWRLPEKNSKYRI
jgi:hypothetical protein